MLGPNGEENTPYLSNGTIHIVNAPSVTAAPTPTSAAVGGTVELLSGTDAGASTFAEAGFTVALLAAIAAACIAFVARRRIIGR